MGRVVRSLVSVGLPLVVIAWSAIAGCGDDAAATGGDDAGGGAIDAQASSDASAFDAGPADDASGPPCDLSKPFADISPVPGADTPAEETLGSLSPDELTIYFGSLRADAGASDVDIFVARRSDRSQPFGARSVLANVNSTFFEDRASISADGLTLVFTRFDSTLNLFIATRASVQDDFGTPSAIPADVNTTAIEDTPHLTRDGTELWFTSNRVGNAYHLFRASRNGTTFGPATQVTELSSSAAELAPVLSADGLRIFFASNRSGSMTIWTATRPSKTAQFGAATEVTELGGGTLPGTLSTDGCRLYLFGSRTGKQDSDAYVATRPK